MEDTFTSTVDGAAGFERIRSWRDDVPILTDRDDYDPQEFDYEDDHCNCSDPGCPCGGYKTGAL